MEGGVELAELHESGLWRIGEIVAKNKQPLIEVAS